MFDKLRKAKTLIGLYLIDIHPEIPVCLRHPAMWYSVGACKHAEDVCETAELQILPYGNPSAHICKAASRENKFTYWCSFTVKCLLSGPILFSRDWGVNKDISSSLLSYSTIFIVIFYCLFFVYIWVKTIIACFIKVPTEVRTKRLLILKCIQWTNIKKNFL